MEPSAEKKREKERAKGMTQDLPRKRDGEEGEKRKDLTRSGSYSTREGTREKSLTQHTWVPSRPGQTSPSSSSQNPSNRSTSSSPSSPSPRVSTRQPNTTNTINTNNNNDNDKHKNNKSTSLFTTSPRSNDNNNNNSTQNKTSNITKSGSTSSLSNNGKQTQTEDKKSKVVLKMLNDITTNPDNPVTFLDKREGKGYPAKYIPKQRQLYPNLCDLEWNEPATDANRTALFNLIKRIATEVMNLDLVHSDEGRKIQLVTKSNFKDDMVVEIREKTNQLVVSARSKSRISLSDWGSNEKRITKFFLELSNAKHSASPRTQRSTAPSTSTPSASANKSNTKNLPPTKSQSTRAPPATLTKPVEPMSNQAAQHIVEMLCKGYDENREVNYDDDDSYSESSRSCSSIELD